MSTLSDWLWLSTRAGLRTGEAAALARRFGGPRAVYCADPKEFELLRLPAELRRSLADKALTTAERVLADCDRLGIDIITLQDASYPERLRHIDDPPAVLYRKGRAFPLDQEVAVAVVGARRCTPYGTQLATELGRDLARRGAVVVSGIAQGIDSAALRAALREGGRVVSVLGGGIDVVYPSSSADLFREIGSRGMLLSEYPPGTPTQGPHYPVRNRIISGLSLGTAVVEAGERSGALITARLSLDQNRDVFAFPGAVGAPMSAGTNRLIQKGEAKPIFSAEDILEEYEAVYPGRLSPREAPKPTRTKQTEIPRKEPRKPAQTLEEVDKTAERAYSTFRAEDVGFTDDEQAVLRALGAESLHPDELAERSGIPARRVLSALTLLEMRGCVKSAPGHVFTAAAGSQASGSAADS